MLLRLQRVHSSSTTSTTFTPDAASANVALAIPIATTYTTTRRSQVIRFSTNDVAVSSSTNDYVSMSSAVTLSLTRISAMIASLLLSATSAFSSISSMFCFSCSY